MLQILLIRPGATQFDQEGRIQGTLDIPLSEEGQHQVEQLVESLKSHRVDAVYASPCQAARQSAEALAEALDVKNKTLDKLRNLDQGLWQGMLVEDVKEKQPRVFRQWQDQPETVCPPEGETVMSAKQRVAEVLRKLLKRHKSGTIALVVPEPLASVVEHVLRKSRLTDLWKTHSRFGQWETIDVDGATAGGAT